MKAALGFFTGAGMVSPGNTPLIPIMTSHTTPSGVASASSEWTAGAYPAWWAFDGNLAHTVYECWASEDGAAAPHWLGYEFPAPVVATRYRIHPFPGDTYGPAADGRNPRDFTLQGSLDGSIWTTLDTQTGHTDWANGGEPKEFAFANGTAYAFYRLHMTENNGGAVYQISQLQLFG